MKLRRVVPTELPKRSVRRSNLVVEVDGMPGDIVCSTTLKAARGKNDVRRVAAETAPDPKAVLEKAA